MSLLSAFHTVKVDSTSGSRSPNAISSQSISRPALATFLKTMKSRTNLKTERMILEICENVLSVMMMSMIVRTSEKEMNSASMK